jgi:hypothetical protein
MLAVNNAFIDEWRTAARVQLMLSVVKIFMLYILYTKLTIISPVAH